ncbi:MAG: TonB family protein [Terracidiphilus sp.]
MFEDSTFESTGRIRTRSRRWMVAAFIFNGTILLALILIPLIYPEALPRLEMPWLMTAPPTPPSAPPTEARQQAHPTSGPAVAVEDPYAVPTTIPIKIAIVSDPGPAPSNNIGIPDPGNGVTPGGDVFRQQPAPRVVHSAPSGPVRISSGVASSTILYKVVPVYPPIAREARVEGTVVLEAVISKQGTIENLRVVSGPAMLQQSALNAVSAWRYRPFLLNGEPVAVETTVNVIFNLGR